MKNYFLPFVFLFTFPLAYCQPRYQQHRHENHQHYQNQTFANCYNQPQFPSNFNLQLPNFPVQIWIDQKWIGNYSQNFEISLNPGRHELCIRFAQNRCGSQINYRNLFMGFISIKPAIQLIGNCCNFNLPIQFSEFPINNSCCDDNNSESHDSYFEENDLNSFNYFLQSVEDCWFDQDKVALIEQYVRNHSLSSGQIYKLISCLDFESSKLKVAKSSFTYCYDKENYYSIFNLFNFSSSKIELNRFISHC